MKMNKMNVLLLVIFPLTSFAQIIKNEDISMREYPRNFARMIGMEEDLKQTNNIGSYAIIKGEVSCTKQSALSLAKRDKIPKKDRGPFQNYSTVTFSYKDSYNTGRYNKDLVFEDGSREDDALLNMCVGHKRVKASVYILEPPGTDVTPTYNFLKTINPL